MTKKLIYRLRDLLLNGEEYALLSRISHDIGMPNTELARILLKDAIGRIRKLNGSKFSVAIVAEMAESQEKHENEK